MASLLHGLGQEASPETEGDEQMMQVGQRGDRYPRLSKLHGGAGSSIEHPRRYDCDDARSNLNVDDLTTRSMLVVAPPHSAPVPRVPQMADDNLIPDMGRMTP